jgi:ATP-dependent RNA helicase DHX40
MFHQHTNPSLPPIRPSFQELHLDRPSGDILIFLTGQAEIDKACRELFERAERVDYRYDVK